jgi:acyl-CoA thioesterase
VTRGEVAGVEFARRMWAEDEASAAMGMDVVRIEADHAVVRMTVRPDMANGHGICHGAFVFAVADSAFALACNTVGRTTVAAGADITFVTPARVGDVLVCEATVRVRYGRSGLVDCTVSRESDEATVAEFRGRSRSLGA